MSEVKKMLAAAAKAAARMCDIDDATVSKVLTDLSGALVAETDFILSQNALDLAKMDPSNFKYDRLKLTAERIASQAADMANVAKLESPLGKVLSSATRPNGMTITKVSVPIGVVGVIYEARPNVTSDVFSLCIKSGNVTVLKGGSDAAASNEAIVSVIHKVLESHGLDSSICTLLPSSREATAELLDAHDYVDIIIPRGSSSLIQYVRENSKVPVIETGAGVCHTYFDAAGDLAKGRDIVFNAKTRRVSVCNALDSLIVHSSRLADLPQLCAPLAEKDVIIYADERAFAALDGHYPAQLLQHAQPEHFGKEFLAYAMSIRTVDSLEQALEHIAAFGSRHSECIVTEDEKAKETFLRRVDAACVYANVSTAFTDGAQFGFGAEIGISTQKLHARGPMALPELTTYKYQIRGNGQTRWS